MVDNINKMVIMIIMVNWIVKLFGMLNKYVRLLLICWVLRLSVVVILMIVVKIVMILINCLIGFLVCFFKIG